MSIMSINSSRIEMHSGNEAVKYLPFVYVSCEDTSAHKGIMALEGDTHE